MSPVDAWTAQRLQEVTPWAEAPEYLVFDSDRKHGKTFTAFARSTGIKGLKTAFLAPKADAICKRCIGRLSLKCLDHVLIFHRIQLRHVVKEYGDYYIRARAHQGIRQRITAGYHKRHPAQSGRIIATPVLAGLHHSCSRVTYQN
jgi:hypothetical protein